jgi:hypothetical protein
MTAVAMDGAARTAWPPRVSALGRALADGLIADDAEVDVVEPVLPAMTSMDRAHVSVLELLVRRMPLGTENCSAGASYGAEGEWDAGWRFWSAEQIIQARPTLRLVLPSLIGTLQRHGLVVQNDETPGALAKVSEQARDSLRRGSSGGRPWRDAPVMPTTPEIRLITTAPTWSPTELGERVLGYYQLAAAEFDVDPAGSR